MIIPNVDYQKRKELEQTILGAILITDDNHKMNSQGVNLNLLMHIHGYDKPDYFYFEFHKDLYECILKCWKNEISADLVTATALKPLKYKHPELTGINFDLETVRLTQMISSAAHIEHHLFILKQYILIEYWNTVSNEIHQNSWDERDVLIVSENIINKYKNLFAKLTDSLQKMDNKSTADKMRERYEKMLSGQYVTVPWGIREVDEFTGGMHPPELTIVAARPSMGKTTVTLIIAYGASKTHGKKGIFFSLEMTKEQLIGRLAAQEYGFNYKDVRNGKLSPQDFLLLYNYIKEFEEKGNLLVVDDCRTLSQISSKIIELEPEFVVIDYLQLITLDGNDRVNVGNREQEVGKISKTLKEIAIKRYMPIIALSQLSRAVEMRANKRPQLSDLRESGSLEQDADNVIFYYRDAYYREQAGEIVPEIEKGNLEFNMAKGRQTGLRNFKIHINFATYELSDDFKYNSDNYNVPPPPPMR